GFGLRKTVSKQDGVMFTERILAVQRRKEIRRYHPRTLVDELIEGVLAVSAGFAPYHHAGIVIHRIAVAIHALAVALHIQLLQIGGETVQVLIIREHGIRTGTEEVAIPDAEQPH